MSEQQKPVKAMEINPLKSTMAMAITAITLALFMLLADFIAYHIVGEIQLGEIQRFSIIMIGYFLVGRKIHRKIYGKLGGKYESLQS